ncbi:MAG: SDR family oxidoreductase [Actinomycetia bacterium]|nr:SDR family oxidoreductase [Actinomycetes bacterium]
MKDCKLLEGKVALITGAGKGIGKEISKVFAQNGADLVLLSRTKKDIEAVAEFARGPGAKALPIKTDVSSYREVKSAVREALEYFGRIDILVNNAGGGVKTPVVDLNIDNWKKTFDVNFFGTLYLSSEVLKNMIKNREGSIINISSRCASQPSPYYGAYCACKAALLTLSETMSLEYKRYGLRVNSISPARVSTERAIEICPGEDVSKWIKPHEVADVALFLASSFSKAVNGVEIKTFGNFYRIGTYDYSEAEKIVGEKFTW